MPNSSAGDNKYAWHGEGGGRTREPITQLFDRSSLLLLTNLLVLLLVGRGLETLPREAPSEEVHEDMSERFKIISACLFCSVGVSRVFQASSPFDVIPLPRCVLMLMYRAVPLRLFRSR